MDINTVSLSDIIGCDLFTRDDGTVSPLIDVFKGHNIGIIGFNGDASKTEFEIKEDAWRYLCRLRDEVKNIINSKNSDQK